MSVERRLRALMNVLLEEVRQNPTFASRLIRVLGEDAMAERGKSRDRVRNLVSSTMAKRGNRRTPALVHPITEVEQGEPHLRNRLASLDLEQLRDIVAEYGMDPNKLVMKWKDRQRVIDHIVTTSMARARKGDAFRS